ncbi:amidase signature enzyme [Calocera cornea HHB12733]|uniref:amidase n=1 Tax=Calocera cornea HHB12733 TaxID=1353952 RepID=A0A165EC40_9BASI|nr:amidase signature enzyme [Calocera cornea HHB12733]
MEWFGGYFAHKRDCQKKRDSRTTSLISLSQPYYHPHLDQSPILASSLAQLISNVQQGIWSPQLVLRAYGQRAVEAQRETNCLTEVMIESAERWAEKADITGPLAGVPGMPSPPCSRSPSAARTRARADAHPVSLKDTCNVAGYDSCIGYSAWTFHPKEKDGAIVRLLKDAGAVPFVKTNAPTCLLSFESYNDVFGRTTNPYNSAYSPGGSSGGESALIAYGGSIVGVGTDVAGSVRVPAHFCGIYTLKCSTGRFPRAGNTSAMPGQEGVKACYSPMARSLEALGVFLKAVVDMKPWEYDASCDPLAWREPALPPKLTFGVLPTDGVVRPFPACARALKLCTAALAAEGHAIVTFTPPSPLRALQTASQLLIADAGATALQPFRWGEKNELGFARMLWPMRWLPRWAKRLWAWWIDRVQGDAVWSALVRDWGAKSYVEQQVLVVERERYRAEFLAAWQDQGLDFLLTVPNATPAVPHNALRDTFASCGYTFLFNYVDYPAGVLPVTRVDAALDQLTEKPENAVEQGAWKWYDGTKMAGLPVGVQVVGRRLEEEQTLRAMEIVEAALRASGVDYEV